MKKISVFNLTIRKATAITRTRERITAARGDPEMSFIIKPQRGIGSGPETFSMPEGDIRGTINNPNVARINNTTGPAPDPRKNLIILSGV